MMGNDGLRRIGRSNRDTDHPQDQEERTPSYEPSSHGAVPPAFHTFHWPPAPASFQDGVPAMERGPGAANRMAGA